MHVRSATQAEKLNVRRICDEGTTYSHREQFHRSNTVDVKNCVQKPRIELVTNRYNPRCSKITDKRCIEFFKFSKLLVIY